MIIGASGYARSGKDSLADILVEDYGFKKKSFADTLRECAYALNPVVGVEVYKSDVEFVEPLHLQQAIDRWGWQGYKETIYGPEIRRLLQRLGTEAGRLILGDNIWVDATLKDVKDEDNIVIADMRFPNEQEAIEARGGITIRINRPGIEPANTHPSEVALDNADFHFTINNSGTLEDLRNDVHEVMTMMEQYR